MRNTTNWLAISGAALMSALLVTGCGPSKDGDGNPPPPAGGAPPANPLGTGPAKAVYQGGAVSNGGTVSGVVKYAGGSFAEPKLVVTKDQEVCDHSAAIDRKLLVDDAGGVANVVVYIAKIGKGKAFGDAALMDNIGCMFEPYVALHPYTKKMTLKNSDPVTHNTNLTKSKNDGINPLLEQGGTEAWAVSKGEKRPFRVGCDVHGWMEAWVWVIDHPYYVLSGTNGNYALTDVPAGEYQLRAWHCLKNEITKGPRITVGAGATATANLEVAVDGTVSFK